MYKPLTYCFLWPKYICPLVGWISRFSWKFTTLSLIDLGRLGILLGLIYPLSYWRNSRTRYRWLPLRVVLSPSQFLSVLCDFSYIILWNALQVVYCIGLYPFLTLNQQSTKQSLIGKLAAWAFVLNTNPR